MTRRLLAVHAHPDDESITMGGTLAAAVARGDQVTLVTCTLGEEGEVIGDAAAGLVSAAADQLGGYRWWELREATRALGLSDARMLGGAGRYRDSGMAGTPSADHPRALLHAARGGPDHDRAVADLTAVIDEIRPQVLLTYDADGGYGHPDHIAAHQIALAAAAGRVPRVLAVIRPRSVAEAGLTGLVRPADLLTAGPGDLGFLADDDVIDVAVPVHWWAPARRSALAAHATQVAVFDGGYTLSNRIAQPLADHEYYRRLAGPPVPRADDGGPADDLFAGLA